MGEFVYDFYPWVGYHMWTNGWKSYTNTTMITQPLNRLDFKLKNYYSFSVFIIYIYYSFSLYTYIDFTVLSIPGIIYIERGNDYVTGWWLPIYYMNMMDRF